MTLAMQPNRYVTTFVRVTSSATGSPQNVFGRGIGSAMVSRADDESRSNGGSAIELTDGADGADGAY
jgi:hypothetical protein